MEQLPYVSIHIRHPYLAQSIGNMIPVMDKSNANPYPTEKPPLAKNE